MWPKLTNATAVNVCHACKHNSSCRECFFLLSIAWSWLPVTACPALSGYPGGLKEINARELWRRDPTEILRRTVHGMLPRNNLRDARMRKLRVFPGPEHPFRGVQLTTWQTPSRKLDEKGLGWLLPEGFEPMNPDAYQQRMRGSKLLVQQQQQVVQEADSSAAAPADSRGGSIAGFEDLLTAEELDFIKSSQRQQAAR